MSFKRFFQWGLLILLLGCGLLISCGPSPEEIAATEVALTAAAVTDTPIPTPTSTPTPTPTPIPYDLSLIVTGEEAAPITGAAVVLVENGEVQNTDDVGQAFWYDLPGETVNISLSAQGYFAKVISESIDRGITQLTVNLDRDPHGILPSEACGPGEKLLYIDDFQDGEAQGWEEIEFRAQGWGLIPEPDSVGNKIIQNSNETDTQIQLSDFTFDNAVWRISVMPQGKPNFLQFYWHLNTNTEDWEGYTVSFYEWGVKIDRFSESSPHVTLLDIGRYIKKDVWQELEISTYNGTFEVWLDGTQVLKYNDPKPIPGGQIGFGLIQFEGDTVYFDNLTVCELVEPFMLKPTPES